MWWVESGIEISHQTILNSVYVGWLVVWLVGATDDRRAAYITTATTTSLKVQMSEIDRLENEISLCVDVVIDL